MPLGGFAPARYRARMSGGYTIGIIGGPGVCTLGGLEEPQWIAVDTPWGAPSDEVLCGRIGEVRVRFLPRHGRRHRIAPGDINARANIDALKRAGCTDVLAFSAVGALRDELTAGAVVTVGQMIDHSQMPAPSFFGSGFVAHVAMDEPVCPRLSGLAAEAVRATGLRPFEGVTLIATDGAHPTRVERALYNQWGADVVGTTTVAEARLAREAELPYALIGLARGDHLAGSSDGAAERAQAVVQELAARLPARREPSPIDTALDDAVRTEPQARDLGITARLDAVAGRFLQAERGDR